jgi:tetratricopeptide (TPR) repeat protein
MEREYTKLPAGRAFGSFFNDWSVINRIAEACLDARIAAARKDFALAITFWQAAIKTQDGVNYDDLPDWYYPVRESLGAVLLRDGQAQKEESVFREDLQRNPRNPRSLFGLAKALDAQGKSYAASWAMRAFQEVWKGDAPPSIEDY